MALSYSTLDFIESGVISAVILLNIILGYSMLHIIQIKMQGLTRIRFIQYSRAEKDMTSLLILAAPKAQVIHNGIMDTIEAEYLVGDIVTLNAGDSVLADMRLLDTVNLKINEASQTGESLPASKDATTIIQGGVEISPGDRKNMAFSATTVESGRGSGVVVGTGMSTLVGNVVSLMTESPKEQPIPLL